MTHVGTIRGNKSEIQEKMKVPSYLPMTLPSSRMPRHPQKLLRSWVLLTSTMHTRPDLLENGKPEIDFYNKTKGGVDCFDMMSALFSCRRTKRWPMCVFYGILNSVSINSWIVHSENLERAHEKRMECRKYVKELAMSLIRQWTEHRLTIPHLSRSLNSLIVTVFDIWPHSSVGDSEHPVLACSKAPMVRCAKCPRKDYRKSRHRCNHCGQPMCPCHIYPVCVDCINS